MRRPSTGKDFTDEQLVACLVQKGREAEGALRVLYARYGSAVYGSGLKLLGERTLAEELVQEVFLKVWRSCDSFDPSRAGFSTWLYRITRSAAVDLYRRRRRARGAFSARREEEDVTQIRDPSAGPQQVVDDSWLAWRATRALQTLDEAHREVIDLAYFRGLSQKEIAERTGLPLGTVKSRTYRALKCLREELGAPATFREVL